MSRISKKRIIVQLLIILIAALAIMFFSMKPSPKNSEQPEISTNE